jgi:hypothetical protein
VYNAKVDLLRVGIRENLVAKRDVRADKCVIKKIDGADFAMLVVFLNACPGKRLGNRF